MPERIHLDHLDLRDDPAAQRVIKNETVDVEFAKAAGELMSLEGANHYLPRDALITAAGGERWVVSRSRFDEKYLPADAGLRHGEPGRYRNHPVIVLARQMDCAFSILRSATGPDRLTGQPGDWVMQYAPGDHGVVQAARFEKVYTVYTACPSAEF